MRFNCFRKWEASRVWHRWFAWHPVRIADTTCAWWEVVERRNQANHVRTLYDYEYRPALNPPLPVRTEKEKP